MAIKVNLARREAPQKRAGAGFSLPGVSLPKLSIGGSTALNGAIGLLIAVFIAMGGWGYLSWKAKGDHQNAIRVLKERDAALQQKLTELRVAEAAKREIQRRLDIIARVARSQMVPHEVMTGVLQSVPQGIWLNSLEMKPQEVRVTVDANRPPINYSSDTLAKLQAKQQEAAANPGRPPAPGQTKQVTEIQGFSLVIKGTAFNNFQVAEFMENLKKVKALDHQTGFFSDVDFSLTQAATLEQVRVMDFEVTANVKLKL